LPCIMIPAPKGVYWGTRQPDRRLRADWAARRLLTRARCQRPAAETKAAAERARLLIEQGDALGEISEDPLQLFTVLFGLTAVSIVAFNGDVSRDLSAHFLELAERQRASFPRVLGHNLLGCSSLYAGDIAEGRAHLAAPHIRSGGSHRSPNHCKTS
jgi:hypothetical protein